MHRSVPPPCPHASPGKRPQETRPLFLSATWGTYIYIHIFLLCFVLPDFSPLPAVLLLTAVKD